MECPNPPWHHHCPRLTGTGEGQALRGPSDWPGIALRLHGSI